MIRLMRTAIVPIALGLAASVFVLVDAPSGAATPTQHALTFIDDRGALAISVQLDVGATDAGHWTFRTPDGVYAGDAGSSMRVNSPSSTVINYEGTAVLRAPAATAATRAVRLHAQLDARHHTAEANLWDGAQFYQMVAKAVDTSGLGSVTANVESALTKNDGAALYQYASRQVAQSYSAAEFASLWQTQTAALGQLTALRQLAVGTPQVTDQGFWYVGVDYAADIATSAGPSTASFTAFFIHEPSGWKLWTTTRK